MITIDFHRADKSKVTVYHHGTFSSVNLKQDSGGNVNLFFDDRDQAEEVAKAISGGTSNTIDFSEDTE